MPTVAISTRIYNYEVEIFTVIAVALRGYVTQAGCQKDEWISKEHKIKQPLGVNYANNKHINIFVSITDSGSNILLGINTGSCIVYVTSVM